MTIIDVAKAAGVSKSTVSRVINGHSTVAPEVTRRVKSVMLKLGYTPPVNRRGPKPAAAKGAIALGRIGVLLLGRTRELLEYPSVARTVAGFTEEAQRRNIHPLIIEMPDLALTPLPIRNREVDGLMIMGIDADIQLADIFHSLPAVWLSGVPPDIPVVDHVTTNNRAVGILAAEYLLQKGNNLVYLNHDTAHKSFPRRQAAFSETATAAGANVRSYRNESQDQPESGMWDMGLMHAEFAHLVDEMLADGGLPDGIFVPTDQQCAVLYTVLRQHGIEPIRDVGIISCNNDPQWLASMHPRPATIDLRVAEQGHTAVRRLIERIKKPATDPVLIMITPEIVLP